MIKPRGLCWAAVGILFVAAPALAAQFAGIDLSRTKSRELERILLARGAKRSSVRLYLPPKLPYHKPTGDKAVDKLSASVIDEMNKLVMADDLFFIPGQDIRLRTNMVGGEAEIEIDRCPADDSIARVMVTYPKSVRTPTQFIAVTERISAELGKGPDSSHQNNGVYLDWDLPDGTTIRAIYKNAGARPSWGPHVIVAYGGLNKSNLCHLNFINLK